MSARRTPGGAVFLRGLAALAALILLFPGAPALAQPTPDFDPADARAQLVDIEAKLAAATRDDALVPLRGQALDLQAQADKAATAGAATLADLDLRLAQLGPPPAPPAKEDPALAQVRRALQGRRDAADAGVKRAKLVSVGAAQALVDLADRQRALFNARVFRRGDSPLTPAFWSGLAQALPPDLDRWGAAWSEGVDAARKAKEPHALIAVFAGLAAAIVLLWPVRVALRRLARRRVIAQVPPTPLRRSALAVGVLLVDVALPFAAVQALALALRWSGALTARGEAMLGSAVLILGWGALVAGLGEALLAPDAPSWRLAPISDRTARRLRPLPLAVAGVTVAGLLLTALNRVVGASLAATVAAHYASTLAYCALAAAALVLLGIGRRRAAEADDAPASPVPERRRASGWSLVSVGVAGAMAVSLGATLSGYAVFGALVAGQIYWLGALAALAYLLATFIDDVCGVAFAPGGWGARLLSVVFDLRPAAVDQIGVLTSAAVRVLTLLGLLSLAMAPFGQGAAATWGQAAGALHAFRVGTLTISPEAVAGGVVSLAIGIALLRVGQGWLDRRFLPATDWDAGVRNSVSKVVGYIGVVLAVLWALAAAGLGLDKVALIASALSVGIGFGLQQIVQNFVSGLILLAERPVKVGDWVAVGGVEGDVRHIHVRATEIQMLDRSTLLVPNSELVTKVVQNKTLHGPHGRAELHLAIADPTQAEEARGLILAVFEREDAVLCDPAPLVFIDGVANGAVAFRCFAYVDGPRDAYPVRSRLYFAVLAALTKAGIGLAGASQTMVVEPGDALRTLIAPRPGTALEPKAVAKPVRTAKPRPPPGRS